jgi:hypothetical protein
MPGDRTWHQTLLWTTGAGGLVLFLLIGAGVCQYEWPVRKLRGPHSDGAVSRLTLENYYQILHGMTYDHVANIHGFEGTEQASSSIADYYTPVYVWRGGPFQTVVVTFQNGIVVSKAQSGLR